MVPTTAITRMIQRAMTSTLLERLGYDSPIGEYFMMMMMMMILMDHSTNEWIRETH